VSAAEHLREAIEVGCTRDDHDHVAAHRTEVLREAAEAVFALDYYKLRSGFEFDSVRDAWDAGTNDASDLLFNMAGQAGKDTRKGESTQPAPKQCAPCNRGACEDCFGPDRPPTQNPYACPCNTGGRCTQTVPYDPADVGGFDFGIPGGDA